MADFKTWRLQSSETLIRSPIFNVRRDRKKRSKSRKTRDYYVLESVDWVNVIPVTAEDEIVLIQLYRHGTNTVSLEIPGGMVDPEDVSPIAAAQRELREETGYGPTLYYRWVSFTRILPSRATVVTRFLHPVLIHQFVCVQSALSPSSFVHVFLDVSVFGDAEAMEFVIGASELWSEGSI